MLLESFKGIARALAACAMLCVAMQASAQTGACCLGCGDCAVLATADCTTQAGTYKGDNTTCATSCPLTNGGFEAATFAPWMQTGNLAFTAITTGAFDGVTQHGGTRAAHFGATGTPGGIMQTIPAHAGDTVTIDFWYYCIVDAAPVNTFSADFAGQNLVSFTNDITHGMWTEFNFPVLITADNPVLSFSIRDDPSYVFLDDITACIVTPPSTGACCHPSNNRCSLLTQANCPAGDMFLGVSTVCIPNPCTAAPAGVCCRGSTCNASVSAANCTTTGLAGAVHTTTGSACNAAGNYLTPCCYANYNKVNGVGVPDIFDFLNDWFAGSPYAYFGGNGNPTPLNVQNIFDFLNDWFAGGC